MIKTDIKGDLNGTADDLLVCRPCSRDAHSDKVTSNLCELRKVDFGILVNISKQKPYNLKKNMEHHLLNPLHMWCCEYSEIVTALKNSDDEKNALTCTNVVTNALHCFKKSKSSIEFVMLVGPISLNLKKRICCNWKSPETCREKIRSLCPS